MPDSIAARSPRNPTHLNSGGVSASQNEDQVLLCIMNYYEGIEPYKFSLCLRDDVN